MLNLHWNCSGMQNLEMYNIYHSPEKINFSTFPSINKVFIPCTHRTVTVTYSKDRNTYYKIQFTNQSKLEHGHERNGRRKKNRKMCRDMLPNTQAITALRHTVWYTIQPFREHITGSFQMHGVWVYEAHIEMKS